MHYRLLLLIWCVPVAVQAGVYSPDETFLFEIGEGNLATPIQYTGGFDTILADYRDINVPNSRLHEELLKRIDRRKKAGVPTLSNDELSGYTADLIRINRADEVLNLLHPIARDPRRGGFLVYTHLARAHTARGDGWREAAEQQLMAVKYSEFPTKFGKYSREQLAWLKKVEKDYYLPWLLRRAEEARGPRNGVNENPDRLFPTSGKQEADFVRFASADGRYFVGKIDPEQKAKLPPDAIAIVQQFLLWHPNDPRLLWQLGELYNAEGDIDTAAKILDLCSYTQGYSNPLLLDHRRQLQAAVSLKNEALAAEQKAKQEQEAADRATREFEQREEAKRFWWIVSIAVAGGLVMLYYQFRELRRRFFGKR